jgi:hypothetical protein
MQWNLNRAALGLAPRTDEHGPPAAEEAMEDPAVSALAVTNTPPVLELGNHLNRKTGAGEDPKDRLICAWPAADIDLVRFQADETRDRKARALTFLGNLDNDLGSRK